MYRCAIEIEQDECGFHAVVIDAADDAVLHVTNSHLAPEDAEADARRWIDWKANRWPETA